MFRNRQSSQKPTDELFERFRQSFPSVSSTGGEQTTGLNALQDSTLNQGSNGYNAFGHDLDPTPRGAAGEPFRFTPSLLDPTSAAFADFANQPPGYYTPTPSGHNTTFPAPHHHHDLQTPNLGISAGTPLSMPHLNSMLPAPSGEMQDYHTQGIHPQQFQNYHPFMSQPPMHQPQFGQIPSFEPPASPRGSPMQIQNGDEDMMDHSQLFSGAGFQFDEGLSLDSSHEKFRFHVTLNAPTAMIKHKDEIPVTYLNKGQAYTMSVVDTAPPSPSPGIIRYRTFVRISFQDEGQRQKPATCWQLWKEGRGMNEAHQRGGKLQAVEYVEMVVSGEEEKKKGRMTIESSSFDGFSVVWTPGLQSTAETSISVRFNFLSTDFSHSKGVKGIPVRLCAKTEILSSGSPRSPDEQPEVCYCKVKLFRDHGAERKLANDILHVKKTIEKLRSQSNQVDDPPSNGKKRKDSLSQTKFGSVGGNGSGKITKHKRTWSVSSASSVNAATRGALEEDLSIKLSAMQDMFTSTRPQSVLYLRGADLDDPDLHPIFLPSEAQDAQEGVWSRRPSNVSIATSNPASSFVSPTPSSRSLSSQHGDRNQNPEQQEWATYQTLNATTNTTSDTPVRVVKTASDAGMLSGWIEAIGIDQSYAPPVQQPVKRVMCVYILPLVNGVSNEPPYYRAVYLAERSQFCLTSSISLKCGIDPSTIVRTSRLTPLGLEVTVDDEVVKEMIEGQDMKVELREVDCQMMSPPQTDWANDPLMDADMKPGTRKGWELCLLY